MRNECHRKLRERDMLENEKAKTGVSRRNFIKGSAVAVGAVGTMALTGCSNTSSNSTSKPTVVRPDWLPEAWDYETDILVVGHGAAGTAAVIEGCKEGLGEVMVIDAAPRGEDRGTSSVCGQIVFCPTNVEGLIAYSKALNGPYVVEEEIMRPWAIEMCKNK